MPAYKDMFSRNAAFQQFETLKRNREKRTHQRLFFLEGVHPIEQAIAAGYEFYAIGCDAEERLSGWANDMIRTRCVRSCPTGKIPASWSVWCACGRS